MGRYIISAIAQICIMISGIVVGSLTHNIPLLITACITAAIASWAASKSWLASSAFQAPPTRVPVDSQTDVIVVGAGVAGAALAAKLARDGKRVMLIERWVMVELC
jgi:NADPH-dependent 2,4-dienoyl-CoA reductase/sulfur reductase-like enzyme